MFSWPNDLNKIIFPNNCLFVHNEFLPEQGEGVSNACDVLKAKIHTLEDVFLTVMTSFTDTGLNFRTIF